MTTNDEHLATLTELATMYEKSAAYLNKPAETRIGAAHKKRADAIRWILAETSYGTHDNLVV